LIRKGMFLAGARVKIWKLLQELWHCLKCHQLGSDHIAVQCKQEQTFVAHVQDSTEPQPVQNRMSVTTNVLTVTWVDTQHGAETVQNSFNIMKSFRADSLNTSSDTSQ
jgi:recombinational DNA repair protein (RecF pathway)